MVSSDLLKGVVVLSVRRQLIFWLRFSGRGLDRELQYDVVANEVVWFAGIVDIEIFPIDRELRVERDRIVSHLDLRREADALRDTVHLEVAGHICVLDARHRERRDGEFLHIEEIRAL